LIPVSSLLRLCELLDGTETKAIYSLSLRIM